MPTKRRARKGAQRAPTRQKLARHSRAELRQQLTKQRMFEGLNDMRRDPSLSLTQAAKRAGTTPRTMLRYGASAFARKDGRYVARKFDRIPRTMLHLTERGAVAITVRSSAQARRMAQYAAAVKLYLNSGDLSVLAPFRGETFRVGKTTYAFLTDPTTLERLAFAGEVSFEDLYALTTGEKK